MDINKILRYIFEELPHEAKMLQKFGPQWKEMEEYAQAEREAGKEKFARAPEEAASTMAYREALTTESEARTNKYNQAPAPMSNVKHLADLEAQDALSAREPGTEGYAQAQSEDALGVFAEMRKLVEADVDPRQVAPEIFEAMTDAQKEQLIEEINYRASERVGEPGMSDDEKRFEAIGRGASKPTTDIMGDTTYPSREDVEMEQVRRGSAEGMDVSELPASARSGVALEDSMANVEAGRPRQALQLPEGASGTGEESEAKLAEGDPDETEAWLGTFFERKMNLDDPQVMYQRLDKVIEELITEGLTTPDIKAQYPNVTKMWIMLQSGMAQAAAQQKVQ